MTYALLCVAQKNDIIRWLHEKLNYKCTGHKNQCSYLCNNGLYSSITQNNQKHLNSTYSQCCFNEPREFRFPGPRIKSSLHLIHCSQQVVQANSFCHPTILLQGQ